MFNALQMIQYNPAINNIPLFKQYCENNGISWWKLTAEEVAQVAQQAGAVPQQPKEDKLMSMVDTQ